MQLVLPVVFHLLPLLPLWDGRFFGTVAALLVVATPYIKSAKLAADVVHFEAKRTGLHDASLEREIDSLRRARARWRALTFLPWWESRKR